MVPDHWSNDAMVSMDRCGLMPGIDRSTQINLSRKSLHEISKTPQFKQGHGIGYTFSSYAKNVPLNSQLFWDLKEILFKISHIKFTGFNRSVW